MLTAKAGSVMLSLVTTLKGGAKNPFFCPIFSLHPKGLCKILFVALSLIILY